MKAILIAAVGLAATAAPALAQGAWTGRYVYEEPLGRDAVGTGITISVVHRLTLAPGSCRLDAQGYQTDTHIRCRAVPLGPNRLQVRFVSHGDGRPTNQFGVAQYRPGQPLLTLTRAPGGRLVTTWQAYGLNSGAKTGRFLHRA
jgi:hypothetical protein